MLENVGRKVLLVATILVIALAFLLRPEPFNLGLDLRGGTRIVYSLDLEGARRAGKISAQESDVDILAQTIDIFRKRVDPTGVLDPVIRSQGTDRIVVELPGTLGSGQTVESALAESIGDGKGEIITLTDQNAGQFPIEGATIQIGDEELRYGLRSGKTLTGLARGNNNHPDQAAPVRRETNLPERRPARTPHVHDLVRMHRGPSSSTRFSHRLPHLRRAA